MLLVRGTLLLCAIALAIVMTWRSPAPRGPFVQRLLWLSMLAWVVELAGMLMARAYIPTNGIYNLFVGLEFVVILSLVDTLFPAWRRALIALGALGLAILLVTIATKGLNAYMAIEGIIVIGLICSAVILRTLIGLAQQSDHGLYRVPAFWVLTGAFLYFSGTIPILSAWRFMGRVSTELSNLLYWIVVGLAMMRYLLMAWAMHIQRQQRPDEYA
jgi:hypothetical protein